ncbi:unnamed protein product [Enterobius vermicularis]|uniref:RRM domain-containing protein n=1 Tax=Enterobius vermicularis TaxID=51028 RepID=A0A0N4VIW8_ENTVE|nr:unnamed protein product [Enterobius vermicularis]
MRIPDEDQDMEISQPQFSQAETLFASAESSSTSKDAVVKGEEKSSDLAKIERKRRWKETSSPHDDNDKDVITVSAAETNDGATDEKEDSDKSETEDKPLLDNAFEEKEPVMVTDDKDEELDYEEALEHASPASETLKSAKPEDEELVKKMKLEEADGNDHPSEYDSRQGRLVLKETGEAVAVQEKHDLLEDGSKHRRVSPARYPVSEYLLIRQLTRPFTVKQLKAMLGNYGALDEQGFWIDNIKSKCIVKYSSKEEAVVARGSLHNLVWPVGNPKELKVDFIDEAGFERFSKPDVKKEAKDRENGNSSTAQPSASLRISVGSEQRLVSKKSESQDNNIDPVHSTANREKSPRTRHESGHRRSGSTRREENVRTPTDRHKNEMEGKAKTADELFQKTKTQPAIYFAPLTDEQFVDIRSKLGVWVICEGCSQFLPLQIMERAKQKNNEAESSTVKRNAQTREERHKDESEKDGKYRISPWRRQKSPVAQKRRRPSRSRSPRRP